MQVSIYTKVLIARVRIVIRPTPIRWFAWLSALLSWPRMAMPSWQDLRFGTRLLARSPAITALVVLALALGIGANSAMFSVVDAMLLHPLNYEDPDSLTILWDRDRGGQLRGSSAANFLEWRQARSFEGVAGWASSSYVLSGLAQPIQVTGARVTANIFDVLGARPALGRTFLRGEDGLDGGSDSQVAVISNAMWLNELSGDPNVLGRTIRLNDRPYSIVGVMPSDFQLFTRGHQIWVPAVLDASNRDYRYMVAIGRLRGSRAEAAAEMSALAGALSSAYPASNQGWTVQVDDFQEWLVDRSIRTRLLLLFAAVGLVLLLACSNVASLMLARAASRSKEIALRISLGATRGRIIRQMLTESVLLSVAGGAAGLGLASILIRAAPSIVPASAIPTSAPIELNQWVVLFTVGLSLLTGILFGLAPALAFSKPDVQETLQDSSHGSTGGRGRQLFRQVMVTIEVAAALMLLASATLMVQSMRRLAASDLGVDIQNVMTLRVFLPATQYDAGSSLRFNQVALDQIRALPGVEQAALGSNLPLGPLSMEVPVDLETAPFRPTAEMPGSGYTTISPGYLSTLGISLFRGRDFETTDTPDSPPVAIINQAFVERFFRSEDPLGKRLRVQKPLLGSNDFDEASYVQIVGVAGNVTLDRVGAPPQPILYVPLTQNVWSTVTWVSVRTELPPGLMSAGIRNTVSQLDPTLPLDQISSLEARFATQFAEPLFQSQLMGSFAGLALVLAVFGIYGINAYSVSQRRREIGVRMALGATQGMVLRGIVTQGMKLTAAGIVLGVLGALGLNSVLNSVLVDVSTTDPLPLAGASLLLVVVAAIACYFPARRATRIDPAIALRQD